jgi:hypothetical protein
MEGNNNDIIYQSEDGKIRLDVRLENETVWLTQQQMSDLYQTSRTNIVEHIKHIYEEGELDKESTCRKFRQVRLEGDRQVEREVTAYNLDVIISLGYRVKTVSPVEQAYLDTIKQLEKKAKKKGGKTDGDIDKSE